MHRVIFINVRVCVCIYIYLNTILSYIYTYITILIIIYHIILATISTLCETPESNNIDSGAIQINCIIIIIIIPGGRQVRAVTNYSQLLSLGEMGVGAAGCTQTLLQMKK